MEFFRRLVLHNAGLKVLSLVIAVLLWLAISREPRAEVTLTVPIEFHNSPEQLEINSENIQQVQVRASGPVGAVHSVSTADVHASFGACRSFLRPLLHDQQGRRCQPCGRCRCNCPAELRYR